MRCLDSASANGSSPEELAGILAASRSLRRLGVCLDTCHAFSAGHDLRTPAAVDSFARRLRRTFGASQLRLIHLNDSKTPLGGGADRHQHIGKGHIGPKGFAAFLKHPFFRKVPMVLETPKDGPEADPENLRTVRRLAGSR